MILIAAALLLAAEPAVDAERTAWAYRRSVTVSGAQAMASLVLPPEISAKAGPQGRDLRLVDETGREVPFLLDVAREREGLATWPASIKDLRREKEEGGRDAAIRNQWTLDLGDTRTFTDLAVHLPDIAFAWHVRVEASLDGASWKTVQGDASLFDQVWNNERVRNTAVRFGAPVSARYLRLTARIAADSRPLEIEGASVTLRQRLGSDAWALDTAAEPVPDPDGARKGVTRYRLNASSLLPFDEIEVITNEAAFSRLARVLEIAEGARQATETRLGEARIFRLRASDALIAGESVRIPVRGGSGGALHLDIEDGGSPPLRGLRVRLHGSRARLLFPASSRSFTLYYGNPATRAPAYDIESLRPRLAQNQDVALALLGPEEANPLFKREPPLRFAATLGASVDASRWLRERPLAPILEEDVYAITLKATDLAALRSDLADLRLVNAENRQVPFLIDPDFADERIPLKVQPPSAAGSHRSLYRLDLSQPSAGDEPPRLARLELEFQDAFFDRSARLLSSRSPSQRETPFSLVLSRKPPSKDPISVSLAAPLGPMTLEIDDGDNAPLELRSAVAVVRVPRIVFKAAPGKLRLLLGNRGAEPPRYDIAGLRGELLAYSALGASAGALSDNHGASESLFSRLQAVPGNALVWAAIVVAMVALVALTLRTLKGA